MLVLAVMALCMLSSTTFSYNAISDPMYTLSETQKHHKSVKFLGKQYGESKASGKASWN